MIDRRLQAAAAWVREGSRLADIGTDHAYLPVYLVSSGRCPSAVACDLREGPLENARRTVAEAGLSDQIDCRLGDGLQPVMAGEVGDIVIAGMGGETIAGILAECSWAQDPTLRFVLQPMTRAEELRRYLLNNGYALERECTVSEGGHHYLLMQAAWTDAPPVVDEATVYFGLLDGTTDRAWLERQRSLLQKRLVGVTAAGDKAEQQRLAAILDVWEERWG